VTDITRYIIVHLVDGGWSQWGQWSDCSTTCDLGVKNRSRTCTDPVPQENGQPCNGSDEDAVQCMLSYCPGGLFTSYFYRLPGLQSHVLLLACVLDDDEDEVYILLFACV